MKKEDVNSYTGKIKFFNRKKGYGFIISKQINEDIFFHFSSVTGLNSEMCLFTDTVLTFGIMNGERGIFATNVNYVESVNENIVNYRKFVLFLGGIINEEIKKIKHNVKKRILRKYLCN